MPWAPWWAPLEQAQVAGRAAGQAAEQAQLLAPLRAMSVQAQTLVSVLPEPVPERPGQETVPVPSPQVGWPVWLPGVRMSERSAEGRCFLDRRRRRGCRRRKSHRDRAARPLCL